MTDIIFNIKLLKMFLIMKYLIKIFKNLIDKAIRAFTFTLLLLLKCFTTYI